MNDELKPCPMCGCSAAFVKHSAGIRGTQGYDQWDAVACKGCGTTVGASDRRFRSRDDARVAWNRRIDGAASMMLEALRAAVALADANAASDVTGEPIRTDECHASYQACRAATGEQP